MRKITAMTSVVAVFAVVLAPADPVGAQSVDITGVVRDFLASHPDFNVVPAGGYGHYAGNLDMSVDGGGRPVLVYGGFKVDAQWRDKDANPIPPHLYMTGSTVQLASAPDIEAGAVIDTYDPGAGLYGGGNIGPAPTVSYPWTMPTVTVPAGFPPSIGDVQFDTPATIPDGDYHFNELEVDDTTIFIDGDVSFLCDGDFRVTGDAEIELMPGATLTIYILGDGRIDSDARVNMAPPYDHTAVTIYHLGSDQFRLWNDSQTCCTIVSPNGGMRMNNEAQFYGTYVGENLEVDDDNGFHIATAKVCGTDVADTFGTGGVTGSGGITSAATFDEWYRDVLGTNMAGSHVITLVDNGAGVLELLLGDFRPADGVLFGNEGGTANDYFTFAFDATFTYEACNGLFFEFEGADDTWVFIDGQLAMDLGGVRAGTRQYVEMDRLSLADGQSYSLQFFFAHRSPGPVLFRMRTNILLATETPVAITAAGD